MQHESDTLAPSDSPKRENVTFPVTSVAAEAAEPAAENTSLNDELGAQLRGLHNHLDCLDAKFDLKVRDDTVQKAILDRLHGEVQEYKTDLVLQMLKPILLDLIAMYDNLGRSIDVAHATDGDVSPLLVEHLDRLRTEVVDALSRQGVESYVTPADVFDPRRQQAVKTLPAPSADQEGRIAERLRPGFTRGDRVLRPERVVVYTKSSTRT